VDTQKPENERGGPEVRKTPARHVLTMLAPDSELQVLRRYSNALEEHMLLRQVDTDKLYRDLPYKEVKATLSPEAFRSDEIGLSIDLEWGGKEPWAPVLLAHLTELIRSRLPELVKEVKQAAERKAVREADYIRGIQQIDVTIEERMRERGWMPPVEKAKFNPAKDSPLTASQVMAVIAKESDSGGPSKP
jgi:hypothetical protein